MPTHHIICLTIDTDPDGLSGKVTNRNATSFKGLEHLKSFPEQLSTNLKQSVPITWFIRIDEQIQYFFGNQLYLLEKYNAFWGKVNNAGHELAWHPHLYKQTGEEFHISNNAEENCQSILKTWENILKNGLSFKSFRNGEGWHVPETLNTIEKLGIEFDSTAMPNIIKTNIIDWTGTPTQPYFPASTNIQLERAERKLLEIPMSTWKIQADYDKTPRFRYINPAIHCGLFERSITNLNIGSFNTNIYIWNFISHPDEIMPERKGDFLYSGSVESYINNMQFFISLIEKKGDTYEFSTIAEGGKKWLVK